eukprot:m.25852 g.25852  ORF g.25852 m.25852 type:complete len:459 (+) comp11595_c0_seq1:303-1679(+)
MAAAAKQAGGAISRVALTAGQCRQWIRDVVFGTALLASSTVPDVAHTSQHTARAFAALTAGGWVVSAPGTIRPERGSLPTTRGLGAAISGAQQQHCGGAAVAPVDERRASASAGQSDGDHDRGISKGAPSHAGGQHATDAATAGPSMNTEVEPEQSVVTTEIHRQSLALLRGTASPTFSLSRLPCGEGRGDGIFCSAANGGFIPPGTVIAFFPGLVYHGIPEGATMDDPVPIWEGIKVGFDANDKRINLAGGGFIDGMQWEIDHIAKALPAHPAADDGHDAATSPPQAPHSAVGRDGGGGDTNRPSASAPPPVDLALCENEYALGHLMNHPNATDAPNVIDWTVLLDVDQLVEAGVSRARVPYTVHDVWYFSREMGVHVTAPIGSPIPGKIMLTTRPISVGAELLFDYNLNTKTAATQGWYTARDAKEDAKSEADQHAETGLTVPPPAPATTTAASPR